LPSFYPPAKTAFFSGATFLGSGIRIITTASPLDTSAISALP
jgi:hypothetical protein